MTGSRCYHISSPAGRTARVQDTRRQASPWRLWGPWDPWAPKPIPKDTIVGKPFLKTGPEGYHCGKTIFEIEIKEMRNVLASKTPQFACRDLSPEARFGKNRFGICWGPGFV